MPKQHTFCFSKTKKEQTPEGICSGTPEGTRLHFSSYGKKNQGVDSVEPEPSNSPPDWHVICQGWFTNTESATRV